MSWQANLALKLRELRLVFCQSSASSQGLKTFVRTHYLQTKAANPAFPFIVRECRNAIPTIIARYDFGVEKKVVAEGWTQQQVEEAVQELVSQADSVNSYRN